MDFSNKKVNKIILMVTILLVGFLPLFLITSCSPLSPEDIIGSLLPNLWVFIAHVLSAGILISVLIWLVWKPAKQTLQKRHDYIAGQIAEAEKAKEKATMELTEANQLKVDALANAMTITTKAKAEALDIVEHAKADAKVEADKVRQKAQQDIQKEKEDIKKAAQDNILDIAFDVAGTILNKEVDKQDKDKYIDELLDSISKDLKESQ